MVKFLYLKEIGKTGAELFKKAVDIEKKDKDKDKDKDKETGFMAHLKRNKIAYSVSAVVLVAAIGAAI